MTEYYYRYIYITVHVPMTASHQDHTCTGNNSLHRTDYLSSFKDFIQADNMFMIHTF